VIKLMKNSKTKKIRCLGLVVCAAVGGSISMEEGDAAGAAVFFALVFCLKLCMTL